MIGVIVYEETTMLEVKPIFARFNFGFSFKLSFHLGDNNFGEYGISFSKDFTIWWHWKHTTYLYYPLDIFKK